MSFNNPFPLKGIRPSDSLEVISGTAIDRTRADFLHRVHAVGDFPVAFIDTGDKNKAKLPPEATVAEHIEAAKCRIEEFLSGKDINELIEAGFYIGSCLVGVTVGVKGNTVEQEFVRLAIFEPTQHRII